MQIAEVAANPTTIYCPNSTTIYINIRLVNTTRDTVTVIGVSSAGVVIRSTSAQLVGQSVYTFQSLSFTPAILRDRDGEATTTVILPVTCLSGVAANGYVDAYVALFVTTTAGQYATKQLNFRFNYPSGG